MLIRRTVLEAKIEGTPGTDAVPTGTDAVLVEGLTWVPDSARTNDRMGLTSSLAKLQQVFGGSLFGFTFTCEIKGSGTAGTAPEFGPLLRACGLDETIVPATSVTYAPVSASLETCTIYLYEDGIRYRVTGCVGNADFDMTTGAVGKINFTMVGHLNASDPADVALDTPTYDDTRPPPCIAATAVTMGGVAQLISKLALGLGNTVAKPPDASNYDGFSLCQVTARDVAGSFNPEATLVATNPFYADFKAGTNLALVYGTVGATAGNIFEFTAPVVYYRAIAPGDREGIKTFEIPFGCAESSADDEIALAFT